MKDGVAEALADPLQTPADSSRPAAARGGLIGHSDPTAL